MRKLAVLMALIAAIACGDSTTAPDLTDSAGNYVMRTINGSPLPFTVLTTADVKLEITAETLYMTTNGRFSDVTRYRRTSLGAGAVDFPADTLGGEWTIRGQTVSLKGTNGFTFTANLVGNSLTMEGNGLSFVYTK
jgi:hypothetical protein